MKIKKIATAALAAVLTAAALTGCSEKEAISGEGSSNGSSSSVYSSSNITANSSGTANSSTTSISSSVSSVTSSDNSSAASTTETSSDSGNTVSEVTSTTNVGNDEPSVIISTITDNSNPQEQWSEHILDNSTTFYVNQNNVKSRSKPIQGSSVVKTYSLNDKVSVVGETDTDYFKLNDGSYVHFDYLNRNPVEIKDTNLKIGDKNTKGYTIIGITSDGAPYIAIDENYEKRGDVIIDYDEAFDMDGNFVKSPVYKEDPKKQQEIFDKIPDGDLSHIIMGN